MNVIILKQLVAEGDLNIHYSRRLSDCFRIITLMIIRENNIIDQFPTPKHRLIWLPF